MTIVYIIGTQEHIEELHEISRALYIADFKDEYPNSQTRVEEDHVDRITGETHDCTWQLSTTGKDHADRFDNYIEDEDYPATNKCLLSFDDAENNIKLKPAYYYNSTARIANGANAALTDNTRAEAEAQGFFAEDI